MRSKVDSLAKVIGQEPVRSPGSASLKTILPSTPSLGDSVLAVFFMA